MIVSKYKIYAKEINIKNRAYNYYFDNLVKAKKLETKYYQIYEKNYENFVSFFSICVYSKSVKMLSLHYQELIGKVKEAKEKNLMVDDYMLDTVLDRIKEIINIEELDNTKLSTRMISCQVILL